MSIEVAIYGKGGIGKSTVSSNLSFSLSSLGMDVIQIGCDPKHDSTRNLLGNSELRTVLDMVRTTKVSERNLNDVMAVGSGGVRCIEAGGPEPGIGCAGKGILTMFQTLGMLGLGEVDHDCIIYDVLGDVVCGGFAVPMRPDHSDAVIIVTSGEFMSLYAANNIMKGLLNFDSEKPRLAGIVFNSRGSSKEESLVDQFSRATGVPVIARIPRSDLFEKAESSRKTVSEMFPNSDEAAIFCDLARYVSTLNNGASRYFSPAPLSDKQLDLLAETGSINGRGEYVKPCSSNTCPKPKYEKCSVFQPVKRIGMGPIGAAITADKVTDIPVVIHGTRSCGYSMLNELYLERLARIGADPHCDVGDGTNLFCSDVDAVSTIFGGTANLEQLLEHLAQSHRIIIVIITCLTNMIGDDVGKVAEKVMVRHPSVKIGVINGNNALEGIDAHMEVLRFLVGLVDVTKTPVPGKVCIMDDNHVAVNRGLNEQVLSDYMRPFGRTVGRGFLNDCSIDDIICLKSNELLFPAEDSSDNHELAAMLRAKGVKVAMRVLPKGYRETREWMEHIGKMLKNRPAADYNLSLMERMYSQALGDYSPIVNGRRIAIIQDGSGPTGWMEEALMDAGAGEVTIYSMGPNMPTQYLGLVRHHANYPELVGDILEDAPNAVIGSSNALRGLGQLAHMEFPHTTLGHIASIEFLRKLANLLKSPETEGWMQWGCSE